MKAPVTMLLWHYRFGYTVVAGDVSSDVHTLCLKHSATVSVSCDHVQATTKPSLIQGNLFYHAHNSLPGPVHCMAQSGILLAISSGNIVQIIKQGTIGLFIVCLWDSWLTSVTTSYGAFHLVSATVWQWPNQPAISWQPKSLSWRKYMAVEVEIVVRHATLTTEIC